MAIDRKKLVVGIILAFVMISSAFGVIFYGFNQGTSSMRYGDYNFKRYREQWSIKLNGEQLLFNYHPLDVENINVSSEADSMISNARMIYFTSDFNSTLREAIANTAFQLNSRLAKKGIYTVNAFIQETPYNTIIIRCENATASVPVVLMQYSNSTSVYNEGFCIIFEADSYAGFDRITDRVLYAVYDVIP